MKRAAALAIVAACTGPVQYVAKLGGSVSADGHGGFGGAATAIGGMHGVQIGVALWGRTLERQLDPNEHLALGFDLLTRISLFGLLIQDADHRVEHWFDLGGEAGIGGGGADPARVMGESHGFVGAWIDLGLWTGDDYPVLALGIRQMYETAPWNDAVVYSIGLAWSHRVIELHPTWRD